MFLQKTDITSIEINSITNDQKLKMDTNYEEAKKELNSKMLNISLKINDQYPELSKYLEEMPVTIPVYKKKEITMKGLSTYYDSLHLLLNYHIKEHPASSTP